LSRGWLLDTNVVSELAKGARADQTAVRWIDDAPDDQLYLSVITLGEITKGIGLAERRGLDMRIQRAFFNELPLRFGERILAFDDRAAMAWGKLLQHLQGNRELERRLAVDAQIAAIAEVASLRVCSRNQRDFERLGITDVFNPFDAG
jgi:predicted nucleic acid-binding protein